MKNEDSINKVIQVNNINIGKNIASLRKSRNIKQIDMEPHSIVTVVIS